ncbi:MAG: regulator [Cytophagaceae bacterium SCN 52-12]|nr:MAG: regulator [Cytophagaceae bacterium SCN 52-12]
MKSYLLLLLLVYAALPGCRPDRPAAESIEDTPFIQEYHDAMPLPETAAGDKVTEIRSICIDSTGNAWIATPQGIFMKPFAERRWEYVGGDALTAPAFRVIADSSGCVWAGAWNGLFKIAGPGKAEKIPLVEGPVSAIASVAGAVYALGPKGFWIIRKDLVQKVETDLARSLRDIVPDGEGGLWIASDVGLYHWHESGISHYYETSDLISGYAKGLAFDPDKKLWVGGLGGVTIRGKQGKEKELRPADGIPSVYVNTVRLAPDSVMWVGTHTGIVRYAPDGTSSLRFSRRWLLHNQVNDMAFDQTGNAWIATEGGVSVIGRKAMNLAAKSDFFYDNLMRRHIRAPWIAGQAHLPVAGDTTVFQPEDDDNDGEYTGNYLAMESFRYAATGDPRAKENAKKAFQFLRMLREITEHEGFFARTVIPSDWTRMHDENRTYTGTEIAERLVEEPRFKPVEKRWHLSSDGKWLWKGDTSSDEMCGHMFAYYFYYTLVADEAEKKEIAAHIAAIVDYLMKHNHNLADVDGEPTRWSVWSPEQLNRDPEWLPDRNQNSMEILAFLKLAYHVTGDGKYQKEYLRLIEEEHYLDNMKQVTKQNPAWFIYFDVVLQAYLYPILLGAEKDEKLQQFYREHMDEWFELRRADQNPLINFLFNYCRQNREELDNSVAFLRDTPLDLVDWPIDHSIREDVSVVRTPVLEELQVSRLPPASIRMTVRWDKNPWTLAGGNPHVEREPVFWLLPYWMGRYLELIE